jgi:endonuclease YncB( thermonuclease family)
MSMLLIEGTFRVLNAAPDGDSIRFYPRNEGQWALVPGGHNVRTNKSEGAQLRLDGIDALETHYTPKGGALGTLRQPADLSDEASKALLDFLGFSDVHRGARETVTSGKPPQVNGYIMTRFADTYGRPVAFVFKGNHPGKSGAMVHLGLDDLRNSANYHLLKTGMAYPTYYTKLFHDIRKEMTAAVKGAREAKYGVWAKDVSESGLSIDALADLAQSAYVMPKLFRRLSDYLALNDGSADLGGFSNYLAQLDDRLYIISDAQKTGFDFVVKVDGRKVNLTKKPEDLIFDEK